MNPFIFFRTTLKFYICLYHRLIAMTTNRIYIKSFCPKFTAPKLLLDFGMKMKYLFSGNAFNNLNNFVRTVHQNTLYQKMNMVAIGTYFDKTNLKTTGYACTYIFQSQIYCFTKHHAPVFWRTDKAIKQYWYIMAFMDILTHATKIIQILKQNFEELYPKRLNSVM